MNTKPVQDFSSKFLILLLNTAGIPIEGQKYGKFIRILKYYLLYSFVILTSSQVLSLRFINAKPAVCIALVFIFNGIFLNTTTMVLHLRKQNFFNILNIVYNHFHRNASSKFKKFFLTYGVAYFSIYSFMILSPFLFFPISNNELGDPGTLLIPCWFPWIIDTYWKYVLTISLQFSWLSALSLPVLLSFTFTAYFVIEVEFQINHLCCIIQSTEDEPTRTKSDCRSRCSDLQTLKTSIRQYQIIFR